MKTWNVRLRLWIKYTNQNKIPKGYLNLKVFANNKDEAIDSAITLARGNPIGKAYGLANIPYDFDLISVTEFNPCTIGNSGNIINPSNY